MMHSDFFTEMLRQQRRLQEGYADGDPMTMRTNEHRIAFIKEQHTALSVEMVELLNEMGWKPWGDADHINADMAFKEAVDAFHFFMNILLTLGPLLDGVENEDDLAQAFFDAYCHKNKVNLTRQAGPYNGFEEKCPRCTREKELATWVWEDENVQTLQCKCGYIWETMT